MEDINESESSEKDAPDDPKAHSTMKKFTTKYEIIRVELDKSLENIQVLDQIIRDRTMWSFGFHQKIKNVLPNLNCFKINFVSKKDKLDKLVESSIPKIHKLIYCHVSLSR